MNNYSATVSMKLTFEINVREGAIYECYDLVKSQLEDILEEHFIGALLEKGDSDIAVDVNECEIGFA